MKFAYLFSGQGAQKVGMGLDLMAHNAYFRMFIEEFSRDYPFDLTKILADEKLIQETRYAQPAILAVSLGIYHTLLQDLPPCDAMAGLSLGEYSALVASGMISDQEGARLINERAVLMQDGCNTNSGTMMAILTSDHAAVRELCNLPQFKQSVVIANVNTPKQIVVGGESSAISRFTIALKEVGIKRMIPLAVSGAFHTPLMNQANQRFQSALDKLDFQVPVTEVYSNTTIDLFTIKMIRETLGNQMTSETNFARCLQQMDNNGISTFIELGPGKTLAGFVKKTLPNAQVFNVGTTTELADLLEHFKGMKLNEK